MLNELAKKDITWRKIAYNITGNKDAADELVQEMYIKLMNIDKEVNDFYVTLTMRSIYLDQFKKKKVVYIEDNLKQLKDAKSEFEICDDGLEIISKMKWWEKELLELTYHYSYRQIQKEYNINHNMVFQVVKKYKTIWQNLTKERQATLQLK